MTTISTFRTALLAYLDGQAETIGENTELSPEQIETISRGIDEVNETVNPNLPSRPTN